MTDWIGEIDIEKPERHFAKLSPYLEAPTNARTFEIVEGCFAIVYMAKLIL